MEKVQKLGVLMITALLISACSNSFNGDSGGSGAMIPGRTASKESKSYWYDGTAEISSFKLTQARYGELREGTAVLLFVTEPFSPESNTKADVNREGNVSVLKMNAMKNFTTGIYPYSLMTSTFVPFEGSSKSLKMSFSMQEWCGMTYSEMRNKDGKLSFDLNSYFEGESFTGKTVDARFLEDDIWSLIRLNPEKLPEGEVGIIPSMAYLRMLHHPLKAYNAEVNKKDNKDGTHTITLTYAGLSRSLSIHYETELPHAILGWEETYNDGGLELTSKAERIKLMKSDYWNKNSNKDDYLRKELGLDN